MYRWLGVIIKSDSDVSLAKYKNLEYISLLQSRVALVENLWKPPKLTEFSSLLGAPPQHSSCVFASGNKLKIIKLANPVIAFNMVANLLVKVIGFAFSLVKNVSGASKTCYGLSLVVKAKFSTSKWLLTRAILLFGCKECSSSVVNSGGNGISFKLKVLRDIL